MRLTALPTQCEVCRRWARQRVCAGCVERHAPIVPRCPRCALRVGVDTASPCGVCLRSPPPYVRTVCAADYAFPWDRVVSQFKFHDAVELAPALADLLLGAVHAAAEPAPDMLLPVPLAASRLAERGYNQSALLGRRLARALGRPLHTQALLRVTDTAHQPGLTRAQRTANLRAAFMVDARHAGALRDRHVALIDDVLTTGATAAEASQALLRAGARRVDLWVLARTPAH